jgi:T6SS, Phospholipase effector Tle1-like, catalytic domain
MYVGTARSANAIDERRKDFDRVTWGQADSKQLSQAWFAGNHSDIGGSYPETESRLSDISLQWMIEEVLKLDHPIRLGPVTVNGEGMLGTGYTGTPLHLYPDATSMQHSEIAGTRDAIDAFRERLPRIFRGLLANANYDIIKRAILPQAKIHPTVMERFSLKSVVDCASDKVGNYRPEALRDHNDFKDFYPHPPPADAPAAGRSEEPILPAQFLP